MVQRRQLSHWCTARGSHVEDNSALNRYTVHAIILVHDPCHHATESFPRATVTVITFAMHCILCKPWFDVVHSTKSGGFHLVICMVYTCGSRICRPIISIFKDKIWGFRNSLFLLFRIAIASNFVCFHILCGKRLIAVNLALHPAWHCFYAIK
jgi:hypothetical protein